MGKGKRESLLWRKYWQPVGSREDVEEGQVSQRVGRGMKGDEDRVPWVKKLISRWKKEGGGERWRWLYLKVQQSDGALESFFTYDNFKESQIHVLFIIIQLHEVECKWRANKVHISCDIVRLSGQLVILYCRKRTCLTSRLCAFRFSFRFVFPALWEMNRKT